MGDSYELELNCYRCHQKSEAFYASSSGYTGFKCPHCNTFNDIVIDFITVAHQHDFEFSGDQCECGLDRSGVENDKVPA